MTRVILISKLRTKRHIKCTRSTRWLYTERRRKRTMKSRYTGIHHYARGETNHQFLYVIDGRAIEWIRAYCNYTPRNPRKVATPPLMYMDQCYMHTRERREIEYFNKNDTPEPDVHFDVIVFVEMWQSSRLDHSSYTYTRCACKLTCIWQLSTILMSLINNSVT